MFHNKKKRRVSVYEAKSTHGFIEITIKTEPDCFTIRKGEELLFTKQKVHMGSLKLS